MNDLISRQAAIDALKRDEALVRAFGYQHAIDAVQALPSAQPQRMSGRWNELKPQAAGYWQCSACGFPSEAFAAAQLYKFCPNCGADMRETE